MRQASISCRGRLHQSNLQRRSRSLRFSQARDIDDDQGKIATADRDPIGLEEGCFRIDQIMNKRQEFPLALRGLSPTGTMPLGKGMFRDRPLNVPVNFGHPNHAGSLRAIRAPSLGRTG